MRIYLMRHGQTDWNVEQRMQGCTDIPLNAAGIEQARRAAAGMQELSLDCILSSPLQRALKTAQMVKGDRPIPLIIDQRLMEIHFGELEGVHRGDHPAAWTYFHDPENYVPCTGGESYEALDGRCKEVMEDVFLPLADAYGEILVCSHAAFISGIVRRILNRPLNDFWLNRPLGNCSSTIIECGRGEFRLIEQEHIF